MIRRRISPSEYSLRVERAAGLAVAQDGDPVGDLLDLGQPVRDVDDRGAAARVIERMRSNRRSVSAGVSDSVGSSSTSTFDSSASAFAISSELPVGDAQLG